MPSLTEYKQARGQAHKAANKAAFALERWAPVKLREEIVSKNWPEVVKWTEARVKAGDPHFIEMVHKIAGTIAPQQTYIFNQFGVSSENELMELVTHGRARLDQLRNNAGMTVEEYRDQAAALLEELLPDNPDWLGGLVERLTKAARSREAT